MPMVFKSCCCLVMAKIEDNVLACCYEKYLQTLKILTVTVFKMLVASFRKLPVIL